MIICKGFSVSFKLANGKTVKAPGGYGLLHDPSGRDWAKCSGLVCSFSKGGDEIDDAAARDYFGHTPREGTMRLPPRSLSAWRKLGVAVGDPLYPPTSWEASGGKSGQILSPVQGNGDGLSARANAARRARPWV